MQKVFSDEPETAPIPASPRVPPRPFAPAILSGRCSGRIWKEDRYDENGTQLCNTDGHVQAWQGGALCGLKLEGAVRTSPLHVCISYALFPTCRCVQSPAKPIHAEFGALARARALACTRICQFIAGRLRSTRSTERRKKKCGKNEWKPRIKLLSIFFRPRIGVASHPAPPHANLFFLRDRNILWSRFVNTCSNGPLCSPFRFAWSPIED